MSDAPAPLLSRLTSRDPSPGDLLEAFIEWTMDLGIELYEAQEEAVLEIFEGEHVILNTPTGSGKSLVAVAMHFRSCALGRRSFYTSPIKALVSEKFFSLCKTFGADNVGMMTGDAGINTRAPIICCTAEVLANIALREGVDSPVDDVIMDEFHYFSDRDRGMAWQLPLLILENATFLLMSATLGETDNVQDQLETLTGRRGALVKSTTRPVPLSFKYAETPLLETLDTLIESNKAPVYVVNFSQREASELAQSLMSTNYSSGDDKEALRKAIGDFRFDSPYGKKVRRYVKHGIGVHHAGLLPKYRLLVERLAQQGLLKVICGTDTLGVGVNVPIRSVLFTKLYKFDGEKRRILTVRDFKQIAGRAGRKGFDDHGYVVAQAPAHTIENKRLEAKAAAKKKKKFTRAQPEKGYVPYSEETYQALIDGTPEQLVPVFDIDHGMMLNLLQRESDEPGYRALMDIIDAADTHDGHRSILRRQSARLFRALREAGLVGVEPSVDGPGSTVMLSDELGDDFSIFHALGLYLLEVLPELDLDRPEAALDIITLVESIAENPNPVLFAQVRRARGERIGELKAEGMDYHDRMAEVEDITYPKPNAEFIYETFNAFSEHHPWVGAENIKPKCIAREMYERWMTFTEYVNELNLERVEGVLLRYLSEVYKTLIQSVPEAYRTEELIDAIAYLRTVLAHTDSSLVQEWERMVAGADEETPLEERAPLDISRDRRSFNARIRAEMHALVRALSTEDYEGFVERSRTPTEREPWTLELVESALAPFIAEYDTTPAFDARARFTDRTIVDKESDHLWRVRQVLVDPAEDGLWFIDGRIDLREDASPEGPIIEVLSIGT